MIRIIAAVTLAAALLPGAAFAQTPAPSSMPSSAPSPLPSEDPAITARAKALFHQAQTGQFDRSQLEDKMSAALTDTTVKNLSEQLTPLGEPQRFKLAQVTKNGNYMVYVYAIVFKDGVLAENISIDPATGKIGGLWFQSVQ